AIKEIFELNDEQLIVPERYASMGAAGAVISLMLSGRDGFVFPDLARTKLTIPKSEGNNGNRKLIFRFPDKKFYKTTVTDDSNIKTATGYLGVDVGSLSTNLVVIDDENRVLAREYLMTEGRPLEAVCKGLRLIEEKLGDKIEIKGAGTTGSGRYLTADFIGADLVKNEITCQATAAINLDPEVDTVFEIGGQDSKYISIKNGVVVDFEMNKACAAGTGSFLQEQAEKLGIDIKEQFADLSFASDCPVGCGERCTVFMESDLVGHQQSGAQKEDLVAGLAYSIVHNYLNKVVGDRVVGDRIFFQGGVAWNKAVVAAFEEVTGKEITVPPHHDVTGAIGAAIISRESMNGEKSAFKGFGIHKHKYTLTSFTCEDCPNSCHIHKIEREGDEDLYYGSRCEKYESGSKPGRKIRDNIALRNRMMTRAAGRAVEKGYRIVIPMTLSNWELYPLWAKFFAELGHQVVSSGKTNRNLINRGVDLVASETCFPMKVAHGHIASLQEGEFDYIFLPSMITMPKESPDEEFKRYFCPYVQSFPHVYQAAIAGYGSDHTERILTCDIELHLGEKLIAKRLHKILKKLGNNRNQIQQALSIGIESYRKFRIQQREEGERFLGKLPQGQKALVVIGRPYNVCDYDANMELPNKIRQLGIPFVPMDFLPIDDSDTLPGMYWNYGRRILSAAKYIRNHPQLYAVYLTNFGCGPDSFISHEFRSVMGEKPYLQLEIDEHSADAGFITRIEAFWDHLNLSENKPADPKSRESRLNKVNSEFTVYVPNMCDHAHALAAAFRHYGARAEVLPEPDEESMAEGCRFTSGRECFPAILTTGDIVKLVKREDFDRTKSAFFMPTSHGPCRFGQYHQLHRKVLDELGFEDVPVYSPSSNDSYSGFAVGSGKFRKLAWKALVSTDILQKLRHHIRAYSENPELVNKVYSDAISELSECIRRGDDPYPILDAAAAWMAPLKSVSKRKPLVGIVGEIYIRNNRFSNNNLINKLEKLGCEVYLAPFGEWVFFTSHSFSVESLNTRDYSGVIKGKLQEYIQSSQEHRLSKVLDSFPDIIKEKPVERILDLARKYMSNNVGGETILSVGKGIDLIESGACGVINVMPFTCMPGNTVTALSKRIKADYPDFPWLNLSYEGLEETGESIRLEAFVHQVEEYYKKSFKPQ
ncbi:MAG: CoA activase, partial [candidate division Zixibacteria bacterium]|nr:CoA activase [candidate division Zixibacteria bacterium]